MTDRWELVLPENLEDYVWGEAEQRGVLFFEVALDHGGRRFPAIVYDPHRIIQDANLTNESEPFYTPNVVLVPEVTKASIARDSAWLTQGKHLDWLLELPATPGSEWSLVVPESTDWKRITELGILSASLSYGEQAFPVTFFDLERLATAVGWADLDDYLGRRAARDDYAPPHVEFYEENFIVIPTLTKEAVEHAIEHLAERREFEWLLD